MRSVGIAVNMGKKGRPAANVVVLDGAWGTAALVTEFELSSSQDDVATQLLDLSRGLQSRLAGLGADRIVVRRADLPKVASNKEGPRLRILAEGALVAAARDKVDEVSWLSGRDLGARTPAGSKDALDTHAGSHLAGSVTEAAAAALAGLAL